jgi:hypothetical protein
VQIGASVERGKDHELPPERLQLARAKAVAQPAAIVAQPALIVRPALIACPAQPSVELDLHGALDDQPRPQSRQLRKRLARVLTESSRSICSSISADGGTVRLTA